MRSSVHPSLTATTVIASLAGRAGVTVIAKLTLELVPDRRATLAPPLPLALADQTWGGHPLRSVEVPSDLAPFPCVPEVVLRGHAVPPSGASPSSLTVRVALFRGGAASLDKSALIEGDRPTLDAPPQPITRVPLTWERAVGGLDRRDNPLGSDRPNVLDPSDRARPVGFGPVAAASRARRELLPAGLEPGVYPAGFPLEYFQCAPRDQRVPAGLAPGDWLVLLGLSPRGLVRTELPALRPVTRLSTSAGSLERALAADLLWVDTDRGLLTLTHRARFELDPADVREVEVGLERDGLVSFEGLAPVSPPDERERAAPVEGTLAVGEGTIAATPRGEAAPFLVTQPGTMLRRAGAAAPPWTNRGKAPEPVGEGTIALEEPAPAPGQAEAAWQPRRAAPPAAPPALPPTPASLGTTPGAEAEHEPPERPRPGADGWASAADLLAALVLPPR